MTSRIDLPADDFGDKWLEADEARIGGWWLCRMQSKGPFRIRALSEFECHLVNAAPPVESGEAVPTYWVSGNCLVTHAYREECRKLGTITGRWTPLYTRPADSEALLDWSKVRSILMQGAAIQQDYVAGKFSNYEEYAARMDAAARERIEELKGRT